MRGLFIRNEHALAVVLSQIDHPDANLARSCAAEDALAMGMHDYEAGESTVPPLFLDTPILVESWKQGWDIGCSIEKMSH